MDETRVWFVVFLCVMITGSLVIFLLVFISIEAVVANGLRLLSIFLGVLAGTSLGEYLKIRNSKNKGKMLIKDLIEELKVNKTIIDTGLPLRKGFWILGIRSGTAQNIPDEDRMKLWDLYSNITHYNEDLQVLHHSRFDESAGLEVKDEIKRLRNHIAKLIDEYLEMKSVSV